MSDFRGSFRGQWPSEEAQKRFNEMLEETLQDLNRWVNPEQLRITQINIDPSLWFGPRDNYSLYLRYFATRGTLEKLIWRELEILLILLTIELPPDPESQK